MSEILQYISGSGTLYRINPVLKLVAVVFFVCMSIITTDLLFLAGLLVVIFLVSCTSRLAKHLIRQIPFLALLGCVLVLITVLTVTTGEVIGHLFFSFLPVTSGGITLGLLLSFRFFVMITTFQVFIMSTRPSDLVTGLLVFRLPVDYVLMFLIALRFIPSLQLEAKHIHEAQISRGYNPGSGFNGKLKSIPPVLIPLVANSLTKTRVLGLTLEMRGYRNKKSLPLHTLEFSYADFVCVVVMIIITAVFFVL